ncbi:MAG: M48 family metallopeptidase [Vampirovibrionales bacterium]|nr:M48 family metallopeptidase [Vampirovibrionales bacterium]
MLVCVLVYGVQVVSMSHFYLGLALLAVMTVTWEAPSSWAQGATQPYQASTQMYVPYTTTTQTLAGTPQQQGEAILKRLLSANGIDPLKAPPFKITPENSLNAATDGKSIIFTEKLWNTLTTTDQRAFVIGHELAHIQRNHIPKTVGRQVGLSLLSRAVGSWLSKSPATVGTALASQVTQASLALADIRFSRSNEYDADRAGLVLVRQAGFNPQGALETLTILERNNSSTQPGFLRSHPLSRQRMEALVREMQGLT